MPPEAMTKRLMADRGWVEYPVGGFLGFERTSRFGRQTVKLFWWQNKTHAATRGIPWRYMPFDLDLGWTQAGRFRMPQVAWPAQPEDQEARPPREILAEFADVFLPLFDMHPDEADKRLTRAELDWAWRYTLGGSIDTVPQHVTEPFVWPPPSTVPSILTAPDAGTLDEHGRCWFPSIQQWLWWHPTDMCWWHHDGTDWMPYTTHR